MKAKLTSIVLVAALASIPISLSVLAATYYQADQYIAVGSAPIFSGSTGTNLAVGFNHVFTNSTRSAAIGISLQNNGSGSTVVGQYNTGNSNAFFIVGTGTASTRRNGLEVLNSGSVNIPATVSSTKLTVGTSTTPTTQTTTKIYGITDIDRVPAKGGISMGDFYAN